MFTNVAVNAGDGETVAEAMIKRERGGTGGTRRALRCAGEKNPTACSRQTRRLATDPGKTIRLNKGKHGIICYKSNQSCAPTQTRDLDPHLNKQDIL